MHSKRKRQGAPWLRHHYAGTPVTTTSLPDPVRVPTAPVVPAADQPHRATAAAAAAAGLGRSSAAPPATQALVSAREGRGQGRSSDAGSAGGRPAERAGRLGLGNLDTRGDVLFRKLCAADPTADS